MSTLSQRLRERALPQVRRWPDLPFLQQAGRGELPVEAFRNYLEQDYVYLRNYTRWYARLAAQAPDEHVEHFVLLAAGVVTVELEAHRALASSFGADLDGAVATGACRDYVEFLDAASHDLGTGLAAMLPCVWGYGVALAEVPTGTAGPYRDWLSTYSGGRYADVVERHCAVLDDVDTAEGVDEEGATALLDRALELEVAFFAQHLPEHVPLHGPLHGPLHVPLHVTA